jgi:hypothetical protein
MENFTTETIGCDLGDKVSDVCVMDTAGRSRRARVPSTRKGMTTFFTRERIRGAFGSGSGVSAGWPPAFLVGNGAQHAPRFQDSLCHYPKEFSRVVSH